MLLEDEVRADFSMGEEMANGCGDVWVEGDALGRGVTINDGVDDGISCDAAAVAGDAEAGLFETCSCPCNLR